MNNKLKSILKKLIIGIVITAVFTAGCYFSDYSDHGTKVVLLGTVLSIIVSKAYLMPFAFRKITGTVTYINVEAYKKYKNNARPTGAVAAGVHKGSVIRHQIKYEVITHITTDNGKEIVKTFPYDGSNYGIAPGAKIRFTHLDDYPEFVN